MFASLTQQAGRMRTTSSAHVFTLVVCVSITPLVAGLLGPGTVYAAGQTPAGSTPRGAMGSPTSAQATPLQTGFSYQGAVSKRIKRLWYRLNDPDSKRIVFHLRGKSPTCAVHASLLDARGRPLAQLITAPGETLPFVVLIPVKTVSDTYYLRLDADPFSSCVNASYVFTLVEPEQPGACEAPATGPAEQTSKSCVTSSTAPAYGARFSTTPRARLARARSACETVGNTLWRVTVAVAKERSLVFHRRAGIASLRKLESKRRALARRVYHLCTEL
jgi:hypothetical protein